MEAQIRKKINRISLSVIMKQFTQQSTTHNTQVTRSAPKQNFEDFLSVGKGTTPAGPVPIKNIRPKSLSHFFYKRYQTPSFGFFICTFLFRVNLFNLFIWSCSNCAMKFWSKANIFILGQYYFPTNLYELAS